MASADDIRAGDVLLFRGSSFVAWAIRAFDGSDVNHAAIALGGDELGEAAGNGLQVAPISGSVRGNQVTVARSLPATPVMDPVVGCARRYLDSHVPYAYQQIVLLALLSLTRRIPLPPVGRRLVRALLDRGAATLNSIMDSGRELMICSEFVYRCYTEAHDGNPPDPYVLAVLPSGSFAVAQPNLLTWALAHRDDELPKPSVAPSFDLPVDVTEADLVAEVELAPLIAAYAGEVYRADELPRQAPQPPAAFGGVDVADEELLGAIVTFGAALADATAAPTASFGDRARTPREALETVHSLAADPNFVTPGDLLSTRSLADRVRIVGG